jgi:hypothetical protein
MTLLRRPPIGQNEPPLNVSTEPIFIHSLLIKPTRTDKQAQRHFHERISWYLWRDQCISYSPYL